MNYVVNVMIGSMIPRETQNDSEFRICKSALVPLSIILSSFPIGMSEKQAAINAQKKGETLNDNSKGEDVRMSNIVAAKGNMQI